MEELKSVLLTQALARIWTRIRERHPGVPGVVLLAAPSTHRHMNVLGHFAALRWRGREQKGEQLHEVVVVAEHLDRSASDVVETLIHEAAHAWNFAKAIFDCSASQYHNKNFRDAAELLGLDVTNVPHYGYALTKLPKPTADHYLDEISHLDSVLMYRKRPMVVLPPLGPGGGVGANDNSDPDGEARPRSRNLRATCECPFVIRVSKKTLTEPPSAARSAARRSRWRDSQKGDHPIVASLFSSGSLGESRRNSHRRIRHGAIQSSPDHPAPRRSSVRSPPVQHGGPDAIAALSVRRSGSSHTARRSGTFSARMLPPPASPNDVEDVRRIVAASWPRRGRGLHGRED